MITGKGYSYTGNTPYMIHCWIGTPDARTRTGYQSHIFRNGGCGTVRSYWTSILSGTAYAKYKYLE